MVLSPCSHSLLVPSPQTGTLLALQLEEGMRWIGNGLPWWSRRPMILPLGAKGSGPWLHSPDTNLVWHKAKGGWRLVHAVVAAAGDGVAPEESK